MAKLFNLARMTTATTGTGTITLGSAVAPFLTFALAGVSDGDIVSYSIIDGTANSEIGTGTYTASGTTLTRNVIKSTNSNTAISLSGSAHVLISPRAEDLVVQQPPHGRVTLTSLTPITASDVTGATSVYYTPSIGNVIPIYDGKSFVATPFSELTLALDSTAAHTGYQQSGKNFDYFVANDAGTIRLGTGPAWNAGAVAGSDTARGTGAASTELQMINGILTNKNTLTLRFGSASGNTVSIAANQATFVGTGRMTADGVTEDSYLKRFTSNAYNTEARPMRATEATDSWVYSTSTIRQANGSAANQLAFVQCLSGRRVAARTNAMAQNSTGPANVLSAVGLDSTTAAASGSPFGFGYVNVANAIITAYGGYNDFPGLGYHYLAWLEYGSGSGTTTWFGDAGVPLLANSGIQGEVMN